MSRTTTALKRLGVPGLAAITLIAGVPLLGGTAQATHTSVTNVTITPDNADPATTGTCVPFRINATGPNASGTTVPAEGTRIDVVITEAATGTATQDVDFCTAPTANPNDATPTATTGSTTPAAGENATDTGAAGTSDRAEFVTDANGVVYFGVTANEAGTVNIQAFADLDNDNTRDAVEPQDTSTATFVAGGAEAVDAVDASPNAATNIVGETHVISALLTDSGGRTVAGVTPSAVITESTASNGTVTNPNTSVPCTASNNDGVATCSYTSSTVRDDEITVYVNQNAGQTAAFEPGANEPGEVVTKSWIAAQAARTIDVTCDDEAQANLAGGTAAADARTSAEDCINATSDGSRVFRAVVNNESTSSTSTTVGTLVRFTVTGGSGDETVTITTGTPTTGGTAGDCTTVANTATTTNTLDSVCVVTVNDPTPNPAQTLTVTGTVRGTDASDSGTLRFYSPATQARTVDVEADAATAPAGGVLSFTATVLDEDGNPVPGVTVTFTENGAGAIRGDASPETDLNGKARVELAAASAETGDASVTATISSATTDCELLVNSPSTGDRAGDCSDTATARFGAASPSPSATGTGTPAPTGSPSCAVTPTVTLEFGTINATGSSGVTVNAPANSQIQLLAYSQPSTTYRVVRQATIDNTGTPAQFRIVPPTNTRLYAQIVGCDTDEVRFSKVLNVRTTLSLNVTRTGVRAYRFFGDSLPARPGGLIVSLYRITDSGAQVLTAQTRASASTGDWVINRVFTGTGRFGFVVRTGQDLQNAPGASNVRSLLIF